MNDSSGIAFRRVMRIKNISSKKLITDNIFLPSRLSRILGGVTKPCFEEVYDFCMYCGITLAEFKYFLKWETEEERMLLNYRRYIQVIPPEEEQQAKEMIGYYKEKRFDNLSSFLQYVHVGKFIVPKFENVAFTRLPEESIEFILSNVGKGEFLTAIEIYIITEALLEIPYVFLKKMYRKVTPVQYDYVFNVTYDERNAIREFLSAVFNLFVERVDLKLAKQVFVSLNEYLKNYPMVESEIIADELYS